MAAHRYFAFILLVATLIYRKLATKLSRERSILGIQSRLECGANSEFASLEEMASAYARIIDDYQPTGTIRLLGFSLGGFIASLMARQFHQSGRDVSFLGLIDSNPNWVAGSETSRQQLCFRLTQVFAKFQSIGVMHQRPSNLVERDVATLVDMCLSNHSISPHVVMEKTMAMGYFSDQQFETSIIMKFTSTFLTHCSLLKDFRPPPINCPLYLWWPSETKGENEIGTDAWSEFTPDKITESVIGGSHYSIMRGSAVRALASEVESAIEQTEASRVESN